MPLKVTWVPIGNDAKQDESTPSSLKGQSIPDGLEVTEPFVRPHWFGKTPTTTVNRAVFGITCVNVAVTDFAPPILRMHFDGPEQSPDQDVNTHPVSGVAVRVTCVSGESEYAHVPRQLIAFPVTVPCP